MELTSRVLVARVVKLVLYQQVKDAPLSKDEAKTALVLCLTAGYAIYTKHFKEELALDDLTMQDVITICHSGAISTPPEKDIKTGDWKYRIQGRTADGDNIALVFTLKPERKAVFITVFRRSNG